MLLIEKYDTRGKLVPQKGGFQVRSKVGSRMGYYIAQQQFPMRMSQSISNKTYKNTNIFPLCIYWCERGGWAISQYYQKTMVIKVDESAQSKSRAKVFLVYKLNRHKIYNNLQPICNIVIHICC